MDCCEFREHYSDFADGLLTPRRKAEANAHLAGCGACRRFDRALRAGIDMLRGIPSVGVSTGFGPSLRRRLRGELAVRVPGAIRWSGAVATLLVFATAGLIGWDWLQTRATHRGAAGVRVAAASTHAPIPVMPVAMQPRPLAQVAPPDLPRLPFVTFHPMNSILVIEPSPPAPGQDPVRMDVPAVWGGP